MLINEPTIKYKQAIAMLKMPFSVHVGEMSCSTALTPNPAGFYTRILSKS